MTEIKKSLTSKERKRLHECTQAVIDGLDSCWKVGLALAEIRDGELYLEDFDTFDEFCKVSFQMGRGHAYRLIDAAEIKEDITERSPEVSKLITTERQARELAEVPPEKRVGFIKRLVKEGEPLTAESIRSKADSTFSKKPDSIDSNVSPTGDKVPKSTREELAIQLDEKGTKIPPECLTFWNRRQEVQDLLTGISRVRAAMEKYVGGEKKDQLYWNVNNGIVSDLSKVYTMLTNAKPYAVCCVCHGGAKRAACKYCGGVGLMAKYNFEKQAIAESGR